MKLDSYYRYEIKAQAFKRMTGQMAPGKDAPSEMYPASIEERHKMWEDWLVKYGPCMDAMIYGFETIIDMDI